MSRPEHLDKLFEAIRKAALPGQWSSGIALQRENKVVLEDDAGDEITLRVVTGQRGKTHEVMLFLEDADWQCDCGSKFQACEHCVAAILAMRTAKAEGKEVPVQKAEVARLHYRLDVDDDALTFERTLVSQGNNGKREQIWTHSLASAPPPGSPTIVSTQTDMQIERIIGSWRRGRIPKTDMNALLQQLASAENVTFARQPVRISTQPLVPRLKIEDAGKNFMVTLVPGDAQKRFRNGAALTHDLTLRPIDDAAGIPEGERRPLAAGRGYDGAQGGHVLDLKLRFEKIIPVDVITKRLPTERGAVPRLALESTSEDDRLVLFPTLVYGKPPVARIDRGEMVILDAKAQLPIRDLDEENRLVNRLWNHLQLEPGRKASFEGGAAVNMASRVSRFMETKEVTVTGRGHEEYELTTAATPRLSFDELGNFSLSFDSDGQTADAARVMKTWARSGENFAKLDDGAGMAPLPPRWMAQFGPILLGLIQQKGDQKELPATAVADVVALAQALGKPVPERFEKLRVLVDQFDKLPRAELPNDLRATLRHYQQEGVDWLAFHRDAGLGALLADDMGLGKTLQALCAVKGRTLVVAPTSVLPNWVREAEKFRPGLKVAAYHGPNRKLGDADLTITSWALLRLDIDTLAAQKWDAVVLDEAQTIKNPDSQVARAAFRLSGSAAQRIALSGTPVENRLDDLWSQLRFLQPGLLGDLEQFTETYVTPIHGGDANAAMRLRQRIRPFVLRRLKREVAPELPPRTELVMRCELSEVERQVYDAIRAATLKEVMETLERGGGVIAALEALLRLRQVASHRGMVPGQEAATSSAKVDLLIELLDELTGEGHKVLVFSQWTSMLDRIEPHLENAKIAFTRLDGSTADRGAVVDTFQADDGPPVMLLSLKAGGTGLNLTAADHVVILDPWWNPAVENQAADRAHRIGQDKPVFVHRLIAADTVEEKILLLQDKKRQLADAALGQAAGASSLTRDDLMDLLR